MSLKEYFLAAISVDAIAGFTAGAVTTCIVHPLDLLKVRLQVDTKQGFRNGNSIRVAKDVFQFGGLSAFYRGLMPNLIGNCLSWGIYFFCYGKIKRTLQQEARHDKLSSSGYLAASGSAGVLTALVGNPVWVIKTRMLAGAKTDANAYKGLYQGLKNLMQTEGIKEFYRGFVPSLVGISEFSLQFMIYENLRYHRRVQKDGGVLSNMDLLILSASSKAASVFLTYPYQVVRARQQLVGADYSTPSITMTIWRENDKANFLSWFAIDDLQAA
ncbi:mitochondrial FAD carrier protein flx1 [Umbelopsis nana]